MDNATQNFLRYLDGEERALDDVLEELFFGLVFFVDRYVRDRGTAEDIAMDTFAELLSRPERYHFTASLKTYLYMLGRSKALNHLKRRRIIEFVDLSKISEPSNDGESVEEIVLADERFRKVNEAVAKLPRDMQLAVHLVYFEEMSYADASKIMKKSRKQVDNLLYRAKKELREILGKDNVLL